MIDGDLHLVCWQDFVGLKLGIIILNVLSRSPVVSDGFFVTDYCETALKMRNSTQSPIPPIHFFGFIVHYILNSYSLIVSSDVVSSSANAREGYQFGLGPTWTYRCAVCSVE